MSKKVLKYLQDAHASEMDPSITTESHHSKKSKVSGHES